MLMRIQPSDHRGQARPAKAAGNVSAFEHFALRSESVEMGGADHLVTHEAVIRPTLVITDDEQDVGLFRFRGSKGGRHRPHDQQRQNTQGHAVTRC